jgi:hypothetical protein
VEIGSGPSAERQVLETSRCWTIPKPENHQSGTGVLHVGEDGRALSSGQEENVAQHKRKLFGPTVTERKLKWIPLNEITGYEALLPEQRYVSGSRVDSIWCGSVFYLAALAKVRLHYVNKVTYPDLVVEQLPD